jgi:hypothetical protein
MFHYTDKEGWNAIRSQRIWLFRVSQPWDPKRPKRVYFTDIEPSPEHLRVLYKKVRVPREKQEYVFQFKGADGLTQLNGGIGRDKRIYFSPVNYEVVETRQLYAEVTETFQ